MQITQNNERTFTVVLSDAELDDVMHEAVRSSISSLEVMRSAFFMTFVQVMACRHLRDWQGVIDSEKARGSESKGD